MPIIDYCDTAWNCCGVVNSNKLEKLQRRVARIVMNSNSSDKSLVYLKYVTLWDRREKHVLALVKKNTTEEMSANFYQLF